MRTFKEFFEFNQEPFKNTLDLSFYYSTKLHIAILNSLFDFIHSNIFFAIMIGEAGTGKTLIIKKFLNELPTNIIGGYISYPNLTSKELITTILESFDIQVDKATPKNELILKLTNLLEDIKSQEKKAVIVFDKAQNLSNEILEELYNLSNLDENSNLLKIILLGQPKLNKKLNKESFKTLIEDKTILNIKLNNLNQSDVKDYIYYHINKAGGNQIKIKNNVIKQIAKITLGNPRLINVIMKKTIITAFLDNSYTITKKHLFSAISSLNYVTGNIYKKRIKTKPVLAILVSILVIATLFFNKDKVFNKQDIATSNVLIQPANVEQEFDTVDSTDSNNIAPQENKNIDIAENIDNEITQASESVVELESAPIVEEVKKIEITSEIQKTQEAPEIVEIFETQEIQETPAMPEVIAEQVEITQKAKNVYILANSLNVRATPNLTANVVSSATREQVYEYVSENDEWVGIRLSPNLTGWVFKQYVRIAEPVPVVEEVKEVAVTSEIQETQEAPEIITEQAKNVYILANSLNIRATPNFTANVVSSATREQVYEYVSENDEWVEIRLSPNLTGWVFKQYVRIVERP